MTKRRTSNSIWLSNLIVLGIFNYSVDAAAPPQHFEPLQGAVAAGMVLGVSRTEEGSVELSLIPLGKDAPVHIVQECAASGGLPERWAVGYGGFWIANAHSFIFGPGTMVQSSEWLNRHELAKLLTLPATPWGKHRDNQAIPVVLTPREPASIVRTLGGMTLFDSQLYYDNLPVGRTRVSQFMLTNVRGRVTPSGESELLSVSTIDITEEEKVRAIWSFTVYGSEARWDEKAKRWIKTRWVKEDSIEIGFYEPFRVLSRGNDYFFLTSSGRLFRAPKSAGGKPRQMFPVWTDRHRPIKAFITDTDAGRSFMFVGLANKGGRPAFFEMDAKVKLVEYDPKDVRPSKAEEPLKRVLPYVNILLAHKRIKTP